MTAPAPQYVLIGIALAATAVLTALHAIPAEVFSHLVTTSVGVAGGALIPSQKGS